MNRQQIDNLLHRIDQLEPVSEAELAALEQALGENPTALEAAAGQRPDGAGQLFPASPSAGEWDAVWQNISEQRTPRLRRIGGGWQPLAAAACVAMLAMALRFSSVPVRTAVSPADDWELSLATGVTVDELEVFGNTTTFVAYDGDFDDPGTTTMIWVLPGEEDLGV